MYIVKEATGLQCHHLFLGDGPLTGSFVPRSPKGYSFVPKSLDQARAAQETLIALMTMKFNCLQCYYESVAVDLPLLRNCTQNARKLPPKKLVV